MRKKLWITISLVLICALIFAACAERPSDKITVVFEGNGGVTEENRTRVELSIEKGAEFQVPTFHKDGYIFVGWDTDVTDIQQSCTVTAIWAAENSVRNKIIFDSDGGTAYSGEEFYLYVDAVIPALFTPTRGVDKFLGWYMGETKVTPGEIWAEQDTVEITLKAKWSIGTTVVFDSDGGTACASIVLYDGKEIPVLPKPTKGFGSEATGDDDYRFLGWYYEGVQVEEGAIWQAPEQGSEVTFTAKWKSMWTQNY